MFEVLVAGLVEFLIQIVGEVLIELGLHALKEPFRAEPRPWIAALGYVLIGTAVGGLSLPLLPRHLVPAGPLRVLNLVTSPIAAGVFMSIIGYWRARRGDAVFQIDRFLYGFLFAAAVALVRFRFGS
jgi:hypothetical protein